jgi:hypothetical protein
MFSPAARVNKTSDQSRPVILLAATLWWPLSARLAMRFVEYGCRVAAICPEGHYLRFVDGIETYFPYRGLNSLGALEHAIRTLRPEIVIPCDDRVVWQLHELHREHSDLRPLIETSLGAASGFTFIQRRDLLLELARELGIAIPKTQQVTSEEEVRAWFERGETAAVLKLDRTWGGEGVAIARSAEEAINAFREFSRRIGLLTACKRLLVNCDPASLWSWKTQTEPSIIIQQFIEGRPANSMLACWQGEVLSIVSAEVLASQGATGAAFLVRITENAAMDRASRILVQRLKMSGFCGLDFHIDQASGETYLIEMNPRCTQLGHLPLKGGTDLAGAFCTKLTGRSHTTQEPSILGRRVAFFPQAHRWGSKMEAAMDVFHDIPRSQPRLVSELKRPSLPERRFISRIYHLFYRQRQVKPVEFPPKVDEPAEASQVPSAT